MIPIFKQAVSKKNLTVFLLVEMLNSDHETISWTTN